MSSPAGRGLYGNCHPAEGNEIAACRSAAISVCREQKKGKRKRKKATTRCVTGGLRTPIPWQVNTKVIDQYTIFQPENGRAVEICSFFFSFFFFAYRLLGSVCYSRKEWRRLLQYLTHMLPPSPLPSSLPPPSHPRHTHRRTYLPVFRLYHVR